MQDAADWKCRWPTRGSAAGAQPSTGGLFEPFVHHWRVLSCSNQAPRAPWCLALAPPTPVCPRRCQNSVMPVCGCFVARQLTRVTMQSRGGGGVGHVSTAHSCGGPRGVAAGQPCCGVVVPLVPPCYHRLSAVPTAEKGRECITTILQHDLHMLEHLSELLPVLRARSPDHTAYNL